MEAYIFAQWGGLYYSNSYGNFYTWQFHQGGISNKINSGRNEGEIYNRIGSHSIDYGLNFTSHSCQGFFGSTKAAEIDNADDIAYFISYDYEVDDTLYFFISYDNYNNLEVKAKFNFMNGEQVQLSRENKSGCLFLYNANRKSLIFSEDYGENWISKGIFSCPNIPIIGITGGRQDGELFMSVVYLQMMGQRRHVYIYHSLDYGETFTVFHPVSIGHDPVYADFIAEDTLVKPGDTVHFTDLSNEAEAWEWDFDNDGFIDSYEQNPVYSYQNLGFYTVMLSITGAGGIIQDYGIRYDCIHVDDLNNTDFVERMENKINIFPNPLRDHLNISINSDQDCILNLTIYNSNGKLVRLFKQKKMAAQSLISIPISGLQNGIYFVNMSTPEQSQTKKVIINN